MDFRWSLVAVVDFNTWSPVFQSGMTKRFFNKFLDGMRFSSCDDIIIRFVLLKHQPNRLDVFRGIAPVAFSVQIAEVEFLIKTGFYPCDPASDFSCNECFTPSW